MAESRRSVEPRRSVPRRHLAELHPSSRTATEILLEQNTRRIQRLVPLRLERMLADPFAFFRGSAAVMAADLAAGPTSGIDVVSCGDAHLANFGVYAAPDRALLFDLNDFDEVAFAPAEWDLKRLATSLIVAGRHLGHKARKTETAVTRALTTYQRVLHRSVQNSPVQRYYQRVEPERFSTDSNPTQQLINQITRKARTKTSERAFAKLMCVDAAGNFRLQEGPLVQRLNETDADGVTALTRAYLASVPVDVRFMLAQYEVVDVALRVVGVGSVGTRCYVAALLGPEQSPLILQIKEASASVVVTHGKRPQPPALTELVSDSGEGARVVAGQRIMQAGSDIFLGSLRHQRSDFYVRQLHDMKGSAEIETLSAAALSDYASACAAVMALAHARSPRAGEFAEYLGRGTAAVDAVRRWSYAYADKVAHDYAQLAEDSHG